MKRDSNKASNFFSPKFSMRFVITKFQGFQQEFNDERENEDTNIREITISTGMIDA